MLDSPAAVGGLGLAVVGLIDEATGGIISDYAVQRFDDIGNENEMGLRIAGDIIELASDVFTRNGQGPKSPLDVPGDRRPPAQRPNQLGKSNVPPEELGGLGSPGGPPKFPKEIKFFGKVAITIAASSSIGYGIMEELGTPLPPSVETANKYNDWNEEPAFRKMK